MASDTTDTREKILDAAQRVVLGQGFASASVDAIQDEAGISRGTFFYHFSSKDELNRELIVRYAEADKELSEQFMERAEKLARDPLQQVLLLIGLYEEMFEEMEDYDPGCLFASYSYEAGLFDEETHDVILDGIDHWQQLLGEKLALAMERHPPRIPVDPEVLADMAYGVLQGAFILSRVRGQDGLMAAHVRQFRNYLELLFGVVEED